MGIFDGAAAWLGEVGFGRGGAFVLCPSDVVIEEHLTSGRRSTFEVVSLDASDGLEFECAGNCCQHRQGETVGEGRIVWWVCSVMRKSGVCIANGSLVVRF